MKAITENPDVTIVKSKEYVESDNTAGIILNNFTPTAIDNILVHDDFIALFYTLVFKEINKNCEKEFVKIFYINDECNTFCLYKKDYLTIMEKSLLFYESTENYTKCLDIQRLITKLK
jgi:hypothetical protein